MNHIKAFISGLVVPSIILPLVVVIAMETGKGQVLTHPFIHFIPWIWGIWNVLYFAFFKDFLPKNLEASLLITGAVLGLLIAIYGVFVLNIPSAVGLPPPLHDIPLIAAPILYAILWRYVVHPINQLLGV